MTDERWQGILDRGNLLAYNLTAAVFGDNELTEPIHENDFWQAT